MGRTVFRLLSRETSHFSPPVSASSSCLRRSQRHHFLRKEVKENFTFTAGERGDCWISAGEVNATSRGRRDREPLIDAVVSGGGGG